RSNVRMKRAIEAIAASMGIEQQAGACWNGQLRGTSLQARGFATRGKSTNVSLSLEIVGCQLESVVQHDTQERRCDLKAAVVLDETQFPELVHEKIDPRARRADHLRQRFLR